jgi:hypothetical protein
MKQRIKPDAVPYKLVSIEWEDSARPIADWQWIADYETPRQ